MTSKAQVNVEKLVDKFCNRLRDNEQFPGCWEIKQAIVLNEHKQRESVRSFAFRHLSPADVNINPRYQRFLNTCGNRRCINPEHLKCPDKYQRFEKFIKVGRTENDCNLFIGAKGPNGYGVFFPQSGKCRSAHRYAYEIYNGPIPANKIIMHTCDNTLCVNPGHLKIGTHTDNMSDMYAKGRARHPGRKRPFTQAELDQIWKMYNSGHSTYAIAKRINRAYPTVQYVLKADKKLNKKCRNRLATKPAKSIIPVATKPAKRTRKIAPTKIDRPILTTICRLAKLQRKFSKSNISG